MSRRSRPVVIESGVIVISDIFVARCGALSEPFW
jgi:hypothetical protein